MNQLFNAQSLTRMTRNIAEHIEAGKQPTVTASDVIYELTHTRISFDCAITGKMFAQYVAKCKLFDNMSSEQAIRYAENKLSEHKAKNKWMFTVPEGYYQNQKSDNNFATEQVQGVTVTVKRDGSKKKGWKQQVANKLYIDNVVNGSLTNRQFIDMIIEQLDMTLAGARTYAYNAKKAATND